MTRVKKGVNALKSRKNVLRKVKGYRHGRSTKERQATEAIFHAGAYAFAHRRDKKSDARKLWNVKINAGLDVVAHTGKNGKELSYSRLIDAMNKKGVKVNRKMLALLAETAPESFTRLIKQVA